MARPPRLSFPGAHFHLLNRFVDRHPFFQAEADYRCFLDTYFQFAGLHGVRTFAYCLMPNHFHVVAETGRGGLSAFLQQVMSRVAHEMNRRYGRVGHLFQGRTKSLLIEDGSYFETVCGYVLLNPVRAGLCRDLLDYRWSSAGVMLAKMPEYSVDVHALAERVDGSVFAPTDSTGQQEALLRWMKGLAVSQNEAVFRGSLRGTFISSSRFRKRVLAQNERRARHTELRKRRCTDRDFASATWGELRLMAEHLVKNMPPAYRSGWRDKAGAATDLSIFLAQRIGHWSCDKIRLACGDDGAISKFTMALSRMQSVPLKRAATDWAVERIGCQAATLPHSGINEHRHRMT